MKLCERVALQVLTALLVASLARTAAAQPATQDYKIDRSVRESLRQGAATVSVILTVKPGYRDSIRKSLQDHGDVITAEHPLISAIAVELHGSDVDELANHPWIEAISADAIVHAGSAVSAGSAQSTVPSPTGATSSTPIGAVRETLGLPRVAGSTPSGAGVGVAIVDSGIAPLADFAGRITAFYDFTRGGIPTAPFDDYGHGTHVAGLIGSSGVLSDNQFQGVAPGVNFVGFKVLDRNGEGSTRDVIRAIEYIVANRARLHVQIINLSLGHEIFAPAASDPLVQAVEQATAAGLIVVASAGNNGQNQKTGKSGYTGITSPGNAPSAITAGAAMTGDTVTRDDDEVASYSSRGPTWFDGFAKPDAVAPGHHLISDTSTSSTLYKMTALRRSAKNGRPFLELSGSSMAAGVTSGVVAIMIDVHNRAGYRDQTPLTVNLVKALLEFSAVPISGADYLTQGAGEINAAGAIALASAIDTGAPRGSWWLRAGVPAHTMIGSKLETWGQAVVWNDRVLTDDLVFESLKSWTSPLAWGSDVVWPDNVRLLASNIVWGADQVWGGNIVWGDRVIGERAGDNIVWGTVDRDNIVWGTLDSDNIVWGTAAGDNIVWGARSGDNIVWGTSRNDNIVWGSLTGDNIVWGTSRNDNIVWGTLLPPSTRGGRF